MDYGASEVVDLAKKKKPATVCMVRLESFRVGTRVFCYIPLTVFGHCTKIDIDSRSANCVRHVAGTLSDYSDLTISHSNDNVVC